MRQSGTHAPADEHTVPEPHGFAMLHAFAQTCLVPAVMHVPPEPQSAADSHGLVHVPTVLPVSLLQMSVKSPPQSERLLQALPRNGFAAGASELVPSLDDPSSAQGPASPPQGAVKPPDELEHAALVASDATPTTRTAKRVVHIFVAPSDG